MDSLTFNIYDRMFPHGNSTMPSFKCIDTSGLVVKQQVEYILNDLIVQQSINMDQIEINVFLKLFKKFSYDIANEFIADAINFYFSHPQVLSVIQNGRTQLFPNQRTLPEIDYDLLIPVFEKG